MFSKAELLAQIKSGLYKSWLAAFATNDSPYVSMKPEYLTTVMLGTSLSEWLSNRKDGNKYLVRFEEHTTTVATHAFPAIPPPLEEKHVYGRATNLAIKRGVLKEGEAKAERGAVDFVIYKNNAITHETLAVFEIKNFDRSDELLCADIERNLEFMELSDLAKQNGIKFGVLTFFLHDKDSMTKEQAIDFINRARQRYADLVAPYGRERIECTLALDTLTNFPSLSNAQAIEEDDDGRQAIETEENHHIVYGVVVLERME
ncbi:MAG: hypothetical protein P4L91_09555 [Burkholderiaceae bacterium]|nr:hypothetical protein [Burkholderiaceae bacterium]